MRAIITEYGDTKLWLSARDTYDWANRPGYRWPCSETSNRPLFAEFDSRGNVVEMSSRGRWLDVTADEFSAITSDYLAAWFGPDHPAIRGTPEPRGLNVPPKPNVASRLAVQADRPY